MLLNNLLRTNRRDDAPGWLNFGVNIIILILTVEIVRLNRINVYLNSLNVMNNKASAKSGEAMLEELKQINEKISNVRDVPRA